MPQRAFATALTGALISASAASAYQVGDITDDWTVLDAWEEVSHRLYDYRGKLVLVNLFRDT